MSGASEAWYRTNAIYYSGILVHSLGGILFRNYPSSLVPVVWWKQGVTTTSELIFNDIYMRLDS